MWWKKFGGYNMYGVAYIAVCTYMRNKLLAVGKCGSCVKSPVKLTYYTLYIIVMALH